MQRRFELRKIFADGDAPVTFKADHLLNWADDTRWKFLLLVTLFGEGCGSRRVTPRSAGSGAIRRDTASR